MLRTLISLLELTIMVVNSLVSTLLILSDVNERKLDNVNKVNRKANKHIELWVKNVFDIWKKLQSYNMEKSVINLSKNEKTISKDLWACFLGFFFNCKKKGILYLPTRFKVYYFGWKRTMMVKNYCHKKKF
jgi:hypothetical protein